MSQTETWTVGRLLAWTNDYFAKRGAVVELAQYPVLQRQFLAAFGQLALALAQLPVEPTHVEGDAGQDSECEQGGDQRQ